MKFKKNDEYKTIKQAAGRIEIKPILKSSMPNKIKIGNVRYSVIEKEKVVLNNGLKRGLITSGISEIEISSTISEDSKRDSLAHEIVHGIILESELWRIIPDDKLEEIVNSISRGTVQVIQDNPDLIDYIRDEVTPRSIK